MAAERLQKILAKAGIASRRAAERLILDGRVRLNGRVVSELGIKANTLRDRVEVDGKRLVQERPVYHLLHKPRGVMTTLEDPEGRPSIREAVEHIPERVFPVGRLDFQTSGVLLLTNDGNMAQALLHPARRVPKVYSVKLGGDVDERGLEMLREGVVLDDGDKTAPADVIAMRKDESHTWLQITIYEGKNRQVHRMCEAIGRRVLRLTRIGFAGLTLDGLRPGQQRPLGGTELADLKQKYLNPKKHVIHKDARRAAHAQQQQSDESEATEAEPVRAPTRQPARAAARAAERASAPARSPARGAARATTPRRRRTENDEATPARGPAARPPARGTATRPPARGPATRPPARGTATRAPVRKTRRR